MPPTLNHQKNLYFQVVCGTKDPLTLEGDLMLKFYPEHFWQYGLPSQNSLNCSYQGILRIEQDPDNYNGNADRGRKWVQ